MDIKIVMINKIRDTIIAWILLSGENNDVMKNRKDWNAIPKLEPIEIRTKYWNLFRIINVVNSYPNHNPDEITRVDITIELLKIELLNSQIIKTDF